MTDTASSAESEAATGTPDDHVQPPPTAERLPRVYHYTTAAGLIGIVNKGGDGTVRGPRLLEFFASDLLDLNDTTELAFGLDLMRERVKEARNGAGAENGPDALPRVISLLEQYLGAPALDSNRSMEPRPSVCGVSFSTEPDLLSQWVTYGAGGGFAIGIDGERLREVPYKALNSRTGATDSFVCSFAKMKYGDAARDIIGQLSFLDPDGAKIAAIAVGVMGLVSVGKALWEGLKDPDHKFTPPRNPTHAVAAAAISVAAQCKDNAFKNEAEWRLLAGGNSQRFADLLLSDDYPPKFRPKGARVVPYRPVTINGSDGGPIIKELVVGPAPDRPRLVHAAQQLLIANGHDPRVVRASSTPYRGW